MSEQVVSEWKQPEAPREAKLARLVMAQKAVHDAQFALKAAKAAHKEACEALDTFGVLSDARARFRETVRGLTENLAVKAASREHSAAVKELPTLADVRAARDTLARVMSGRDAALAVAVPLAQLELGL